MSNISNAITDEMSPDASPGQQSRHSGVRRVNNLPVYIVVGGLAVFLLIMVLVAADRAASQSQPGQRVEAGQGGNTSMYAKEIAGDRKDGMVQAKNPAPPAVPDLTPPESVPIGQPSSLDGQPPLLVPPGSEQQALAQQGRSMRDEEADRIRIIKLQQFEEAVKAKTTLPITVPRSTVSSSSAGPVAASAAPGAPATRDEVLARLAAVRQQIESSTRDDPTAAYKARLQQIQAAGVAGASPGRAQGGASPKLMQLAAGRNDIAQFGGSGQGDRWRLESQLEAPRSRYELRAGFVVPAILISGINSELPGQIMAQVSQDVYDTPLGQYKLIPQGARLIGSYANEVAYGQSRILIAWQRIIFPDGKAMDIGAMPGADSAGYAGFKDQVNNHYVRLFSSAFLMSGVTAGIALSQPEAGNPYARPTASSALSEALGQQLGQVTAQLIAKNLNIAPTLEIRPGYRFNVIVVKDMTFTKPYAAFDY
ncbi:TrbI/VirB10 family protein [Massilia sp. PWRC2]|uniref:TrbI/VirB10 family protein n=1 Tax=Massilia sp. PWRC2 TaxID=2804626 RepID=UPI003CF79898